MTTNEIKTLIQNTIAGQGSQVDIGGKLAEILGAIVDAIPSGEMPRPIVLTAAPVEGDTLETLAEKGLTLDEISAAAQGLRTGVVVQSAYYHIIMATHDAEDYSFRFASISYDDTGVVVELTQYTISVASGSASVAVVEI